MLMDYMITGGTLSTLWIWWVMIISWGSLFFIFTSHEARWAVGVWLVYLAALEIIYSMVGLTRLSELTHLVLWTPLVLYFILRIPRLDFAKLSSFYVLLFTLTYSGSLLVGYLNLWNWLSGDSVS